MKHFKTIPLCLVILSVNVFIIFAQNPVGKNLHQVIGMWGSNYKMLNDAQGLHMLQYNRVVKKDTVPDLLYFEGFTCVKEVSVRPADQKNLYIDSLNRQYTPAGTNWWLTKDSTYITTASRDGFFNITSFSAAYYRKLSH